MWHLDILAFVYYGLAFLVVVGISNLLVASYEWFERYETLRIRSQRRVAIMRDLK